MANNKLIDKACLVGGPEGLAISIIEKLLASDIHVTVFSEKISDWKRATGHLGENSKFELLPLRKLIETKDFDYNIYVNYFFSKIYKDEDRNELYKKDELIIQKYLSDRRSLCSVFVFPLNTTEEHRENVEKLYCLLDDSFQNLTFFLSDPVGPRCLITKRFYWNSVIKSVLENERSKINEDNKLFVTQDSAAVYIIRKLFMGSGGGGPVAIIGKDNSGKINETFNEIGIKTFRKETSAIKYFSANIENRVELTVNTKHCLKETINWHKKVNVDFLYDEDLPESESVEIVKEVKKDTKKNYKNNLFEHKILKAEPSSKRFEISVLFLGVKKRIHNFRINKRLQLNKTSLIERKTKTESSKDKRGKRLGKRGKLLILGFTLFIALHLGALVAGLALYVGGKYMYDRGGWEQSSFYLYYSYKTIDSVSFVFGLYSKIPYAGELFRDTEKSLTISKNAVLLSKYSSDTYKTLGVFLRNVFVEKRKDLVAKDLLTANLDALFRQISFLEGEAEQSRGFMSTKLSEKLAEVNIVNTKNDIENIKTLIEQLDEMVAVDGKKEYLILLVNNRQLKPSGGKIMYGGSANFENGILNSFSLSKVESLDKRLKGWVEPPEQLQKYLSYGGWNLEESNWAVDYRESAEKSMWFYEKELDITTEGVITINLDVIKSLVEVIGEVWIPQYKVTIDKNNFHEIVGYETEKSAGENKQSDFVLKLVEEVLNKVFEFRDKDLLGLVGSIKTSLDQKNVLVYLSDNNLEENILHAGWGGGFGSGRCESENCIDDWISVSETNVGNNNAEAFVVRKLNANVVLSDSVIKKKVRVIYENKSDIQMSEKGTYKVYVRNTDKKGSQVKSVLVKKGSNYAEVDPEISFLGDLVEAGVYIEVKPGQRVEIVFETANESYLDFLANGDYYLRTIKQPGVNSIPLTLSLSYPRNINITSKENIPLTLVGEFYYNTDLSQDLDLFFYW